MKKTESIKITDTNWKCFTSTGNVLHEQTRTDMDWKQSKKAVAFLQRESKNNKRTNREQLLNN